MRKCRNLFRCFQPRDSKWKIFIQIVSIVCVVSLLFSFYQEKYEKEVLIELALGSGSVEELVKPDNDTLLVNGPFNGPSKKLKGKSPFVVIAVTSLPANVFRRNIIRNTWAAQSHEKFGAAVIFFVGKPNSLEEMANLIREAEKHEDLVVDDFHESYYALSIKTLRVFKYFKFYHPKSKFLVKTDDDVFVNVRNLVHYCYERNHEFEARFHQQEGDFDSSDNIKSFLPPFHFVGGVIHDDRKPHTWNSFSKWYVPPNVWKTVFNKVEELTHCGAHATNAVKIKMTDGESGEIMESKKQTSIEIQENMYPPYAEGNFYVLSDDAVIDILNASHNVPLYHLEDVYVTGVLATWVLGVDKERMPSISSASNIFPGFSYRWYKIFTPPEELIAFHCDNNVELITTIYNESIK